MCSVCLCVELTILFFARFLPRMNLTKHIKAVKNHPFISHYLIKNEEIVEEWMIFDGFDVLCQIHAG